MVKKLLLITLLIGCLGGIIGSYFYNKKPIDVKKAASQFEVPAVKLVTEYSTDEAAANIKYLDKIITVSGAVSDVQIDGVSATVFLASGDPMVSITCSFYDSEIENVKSLVQGTTVKIKGQCTGKLMDVVLNKCSIEE